MVDFAISLDFFILSLQKVCHKFVIGCSLIGFPPVEYERNNFYKCRPHGYLVNQCSAQQSRSALSSFPQYRLQLGDWVVLIQFFYELKITFALLHFENAQMQSIIIKDGLRHHLSFYGVLFVLGTSKKGLIVIVAISLSQPSSVRAVSAFRIYGLCHPMKLVPLATLVHMDIKAFPSRSSVPLLITNSIIAERSECCMD
ncbi:hypothetical protein T01_9794 [Trichinella spiralis]|uniref:Uncharacterized protein n=1 Tax=Trichinella spiralis TaxID=6334 RepID=A0A0V1BIX5_TRISP|nr:hypothetical protein T01_9794 [Trichinella spiralis]